DRASEVCHRRACWPTKRPRFAPGPFCPFQLLEILLEADADRARLAEAGIDLSVGVQGRTVTRRRIVAGRADGHSAFGELVLGAQLVERIVDVDFYCPVVLLDAGGKVE